MADKKSSLVQIAQDVLDVSTQSIKTNILVDGAVVDENNPLPVVIDSQSIVVEVGLDKDNDSVTAWQGGGAWAITNTHITEAVATSANQDSQITELQAIKGHVDNVEGKLDTLINQTDGIEGSLSSIDTKVATAAKQDSQITELQAIKGYVDGVEGLLTSVVDSGNSSTSPLGVSGVFTGTSFDAKDFATLSISVISDQSSAVNGISVQFSQDGTNWDHVHTYTYITSANGLSYNLPLEMRYVRIVYTNGAVAQTSFRLQSVLRRTQVPPSVYTLEQGINDYTVASPTKSVIYGKTTGGGGGYVAVKVNPSGALTTEVSGTVTVTGGATAANQTEQTTELQLIKANTARLDFVSRIRLVYSSTNVTTGAWVQLSSSIGAIAVKEIEIFDSSGETLELGLGASGSEVSKSYVFPGGNGKIPMQIPANSRVAIKAVTATANSGEIIINLYG